MANRAVAIRRRSTRRRSSSGRRTKLFNFSGNKIPLSIIAGLAPGVMWASEPVRQGRTWDETWQRFIAAYTGYSYGEKAWSMFYLSKGLFPLFGAMLAHGLANWVGLNGIIRRFNIPVEI